MVKQKTKLTPKKIFISVTSLVLVLTLLITAMFVTSRDGGLRVSAAGGVLTSVSGNNIIPAKYEGVNVPAGTKLVSETQYTQYVNGTSITPSTSTDGVAAFDFHIFAENFAAGIHTCGNLAVQHLGGEVLGSTAVPEFGSRTEHDTLSEKLSYIGDTVSWSQATKINSMALVFGPDNTVTGDGQIYLNSNGYDLMLGNGAALKDHIFIDDESDGTPFIDITTELEEAEDYQRYLVWLQEQIQNNSTYVQGWGYATEVNGETARVLTYNDLYTFTWGSITLDFSKFTEETIIVDFDTYYSPASWWMPGGYYTNANALIAGQVTIKGTAGKRVIMNVDTTNLVNDSVGFYNITMSVDGLSNSESTVEQDNNVLWNFYQKNDSDGVVRSTTGQIDISGTWVGTVLAPDATVNCNAGLNGSIIAENVSSGCETHKSDYTGEKINQVEEDGTTSLTVTKIWDDNPDTRPDYISIKLLQDGTVYKTVQIGKTTTGVSVSDDGNTWTYTFEDLPQQDVSGNYYRYSIDEVVPAGYEKTVFNNTIINTSIGGADEVIEYGSMTVSKKDTSGNLLGGAWFRLVSNSGGNLSGATVTSGTANSFNATDNEVTWCSVKDSAVTIGNLPVGSYTLYETSAPSGYKAGASQNITITKDSTAPVSVVNEQVSIRFAKLDENGDMLTGATLKLTSSYGADMSNLTVSGATIVSQDSSQLTVKTTGTEFKIAGITEGSYTLTEIEAPTGYLIAAPRTLYIGSNGEVYDTTSGWNWVSRVEMTDELAPVIEEGEPEPEIVYHNIYIDKTNGATSLAGAVLELASVTGADLSATDISNADNISYNGSSITFTSKDTPAYFENLPEGYYTLTEITAPDGYKKAAQMTLNVANDNETFTMTDSVITMSVSKRDSNSGVEITGASLMLTASGVDLSGVTAENANDLSATASAVTWTSTGTPAVFEKLPAGSYTLSEITAPSGYSKASDIYFTIDEYGNITGSSVNGTECVMYDAPVVLEISKLYWNDKDGDSNVDSGEKGNLSGAKLKLTADADLSNVSGTISVTHEADGSLTWTSTSRANTLRGLPDGSYTLTELSAPDGYDAAEPIYFTVSGGVINSCTTANTGDEYGTSYVKMCDKKTVLWQVQISKVDAADNSVLLEGATLGIFPEGTTSFIADNAVVVYESTNAPNELILANGNYILRELKSPEGYDLNSECICFTVYNGDVTITDVYTPAGNIIVGKMEDTYEGCNYFNGENLVHVNITEFVEANGHMPPDKVVIKIPNANYTDDTMAETILAMAYLDEDAQGVAGIWENLMNSWEGVLFTSFDDVPDNKYRYIVNNLDGYDYIVFDITSVPNVDQEGIELDRSVYSTAEILFWLKDSSGTDYHSSEELWAELGAEISIYYGDTEIILGDKVVKDGESSGSSGSGGSSASASTLFTEETIPITYWDWFVGYHVDITEYVAQYGWPTELIMTPDAGNLIGGISYNVAYSNDATNGTQIGSTIYSYNAVQTTDKWTYTIDSSNVADYDPDTHGKVYLIAYKNDSGMDVDTLNSCNPIIMFGDVAYSGDSNDDTVSDSDAGSTGGSSSSGITTDSIIVEDATDSKPVVIKLPNSETPQADRYLYAVQLTKKDQDDNAITNNQAQFLLYDSNGNIVNLTGSNGVYAYNYEKTPDVTFTGTEFVNNTLSQSDITLTELPIAINYNLPGGVVEGSTIEIVISNSDGNSVTLPVQTLKTTNGSIKNIDLSDLDYQTGEALTVTVNETYPSGSSAFTVDLDFVYPLYTSSAAGTINVTGLWVGDYYFREIEAPTNYLIDSEVKQFSLTEWNTEGNPLKLSVTNTLEQGTFTIIKTDDNGNPKEGAVFEIFRINDAANYNEWYNGTTSMGYFTTDHTGKVTATGLDLGYLYYAVEITAPAGTANSNADVKLPQLETTGANARKYIFNGIEVNYGIFLGDIEGVGIMQIPDTSSETEAWIDTDAEISDGTVTVENRAYRTTFLKTDENGDALAGATLKLTYSGVGDTAKLGDVSAYIITTDSDGAEVLTPVALTHVHNCYKDDAGNITYAEEYITWTSTDDSVGVTLLGLPTDITYSIEETVIPEGYKFKSAPSSVSANNELDTDVIYTVVNEKLYGKITLVKNDSITGKKLADITFVLETSTDGGTTWSEYKTYTTDANGTITATGLPYGASYRFKETVPIGYTTDNVYTEEFTIKGTTSEELTHKVYVSNTPLTGTITLTKTDSVSGNVLAGAKYQLYYSTNDTDYSLYSNTEYETDENGTITVEDLPWGYYYKFKETLTPNGYVKYDGYTESKQITTDVLDVSVAHTNAPLEGFVELTAVKTISGRDMKDDDKFEFVLKEGDTVLEIVENNGSEIKFGKISYAYAEVGTHTYTISEKEYDANGIKNDSTVHTVKVTVEVSADGKSLTATPDKTGDDIIFENTYSTSGVDVVFEAKKILNGREIIEGEFEFTLTGNDGTSQTKSNASNGIITFDAIKYDLGDAGETYTYTIREVEGTLGGVTYAKNFYEVTVTVVDNGDGTLTATPSMNGGDSLVFTNEYNAEATEVTLKAHKTLKGIRKLEAGEFSFVLKDASGNVIETVSNDADGNATFKAVPLSEAKTYNFTISEIKGDKKGVTYDETDRKVVVVVEDDTATGKLKVTSVTIGGENTNTAEFTNNYNVTDAEVKLTGKKTLNVSNSSHNLAEGEFSFILKDESGNEIDKVNNDADGNFEFKLTYGEAYAGKTLKYTISEKDDGDKGVAYDTTVYYVEIEITDNKEGKLEAKTTINDTETTAFSFTNNYTAVSTTGSVSGTKKYNKELVGDEFEFVLKDESGNEIKTVSNDANGSFTFSDVPFTKAGTFTYTIEEVDGKLGYIAYDESVYTWTVVVTDNEGELEITSSTVTNSSGDEAALEFTNEYLTGSVNSTISGTKELLTPNSNRTLKGEEFTFSIVGPDVNKEVKNSADRTINFGTFNYTAAGDYVYTIKEVAGDKDYIEYDSTEYTVTVKVSDDDAGTLSATQVITANGEEKDEVKFSNTYTAAATTTQINGVKVLKGRDLDKNEFAFELKDKATGVVLQTVSNTDAGTFTFKPIEYNATGTYTYTVAEVDNGLGGVTYDKNFYEVTVTVKDNGNGTLTATADKSSTDITFENTYKAEETSIDLEGKKIYNNGSLEGDDFTFVLTDSTGTEYTAQNDENGDFSFAELKFSKAGNYYYTITEKDDGKGGVKYDDSTINVAILVTDNGYGTLSAKIVTTKDGAGTDITFTNTYTAQPATVALDGTKVYNKTLNGNEFEFILSGTDLAQPITVKNDSDGNFTFGTISLNEAKTYTYTITEKNGGTTVNGISYDDSVYTRTIIVSDPGNGQLIITSDTLKKNNAAHEGDVVFTNTYTAQPATVALDGTKVYNKTLNGDEFEFILSGTDLAQPITVKNDSNGNFTFGTISLNEAKTYTYTITEKNGGKKINGISYDDSVYTRTIVVSDPGNGQLIITSDTLQKNNDAPEGDVVFNNTYSVEPAKETFNGVKNYNKSFSGTDFEFILSGTDLAQPITVENDSNGNFTFGELTFTEAKTYTYTITEKNGGKKINGITYDDAVYEWTVEVEDNGEGQLEAEKTLKKNGKAYSGDVEFRNTYAAASATYTVVGTKVLSGSDLEADQFTFTLSGTGLDEALTAKNADDGSFAFDPIRYTAEGTYEYEVSEVIPAGDKEGIIYDDTKYTFTVTVTDNGRGQLEAAGPENLADTLKFTNIYNAQPTKESVNGVKTLVGRKLTAGEFIFTLTGEGESQTVSNTDAGTFAFSDITFDEAGTYTYTIKETAGTATDIYYDTTEYVMTVTVVDNGNGELEATKSIVKKGEEGEVGIRFENRVIASELTLSKIDVTNSKELPGAELTLTPVDGADISAAVALLPQGVEYKDGSIQWRSGNTAVTLPMIPDGVYRFTEVTAPDGYDVAETVYVKIENGKVYTVLASDYKADGSTVWGEEVTSKTVIMEDAPNKLVLSKREFADGDEIPGATLILKPVDDINLENVIVPDNVSNTDGVITWTSGEEETEIGRVPDGIYEFTEITAPDGYEVAETIFVKVSASDIYYADSAEPETWTEVGESDTVIMLDAPTKVYVSKIDAVGGNELPGAVLTIEPAEGYNIKLSNVTAPSHVSVTDLAITWTSTDTKTEIERLPQGVYTLTETTAPSGYERDEVAYIKVSGSDIYSVKESDYKGTSTVWNKEADETVVMEDAYNTLVLSKQEVGGGDELLNAILTLEATSSDTDLTVVEVSRTDVDIKKNVITWVSTENALDLHFVPDGIYKFTEVRVPDGYEQAEFIYVKVENGNIYNAKYNEETKAYGEWTLADKDTVVMEDKPTELILSKIAFGGSEELVGAKLKLEAVGDTAKLTDVKTSREVSNTDGVISWTSSDEALEIERIPEGIYKFTEITAPQGYEVAETIYVKVSGSDIYSVKETDYKEDGTTEWGEPVSGDKVIMVDNPIVIPETANISFVKYSDINKILPGATFTLTGTDGSKKTSTSGIDGYVVFNAVNEGTYTLTETAAPANYNKSTSIITVIIDSEGEVTYKGPNGNAIDIMGIEQLMKNTVIPVEDEQDVTVGDTVDLMDDLIKENPDLAGETITWESEDTTIATVDQNGKVTVKKPGSVTINAYKDGVVVGTFVLGASEENIPNNNTNNNNNNTPNTGDTDTPTTGDDNKDIIAWNIAIVSLVVAIATAKVISSRRKRRAN